MRAEWASHGRKDFKLLRSPPRSRVPRRPKKSKIGAWDFIVHGCHVFEVPISFTRRLSVREIAIPRASARVEEKCLRDFSGEREQGREKSQNPEKRIRTRVALKITHRLTAAVKQCGGVGARFDRGSSAAQRIRCHENGLQSLPVAPQVNVRVSGCHVTPAFSSQNFPMISNNTL